MQKRMVDFIRALRAAGIRISLAESQDAMSSVEEIGIRDMDLFRLAMSSTLVKEHPDQDTFEYYFPLFFKNNQPPLEDINQQLSPEDQQMLQDAMQALMGNLDALKQLMQRLMDGQPFSEDEMQQLGDMSGLPNGDEMYMRQWFERRMNRQAGLSQMEKWMDQLMEMLEAMGMSDGAREELAEMLQENMQGLSEQLSQYVGQSLAEQMAERPPDEKPDLLDVPLSRLSQNDLENIREEIRRLVARLRSRAALRQKRAKTGDFDPRKTMRQNMRYGGVPVVMKFKNRHKKPSLVLICDLSTSMRYSVEFLLTMVYELQDQVRRTSSFIFISDMVDISMEMKGYEPKNAVHRILMDNPPGYYSTDLGNSLNTFHKNSMQTIDHRTTVIFFGDGRNNYNDPRLDIVQEMRRKGRRLIWFCPEPKSQWGTGDSDMWEYSANADAVFRINSLRDLANAVDKILADG